MKFEGYDRKGIMYKYEESELFDFGHFVFLSILYVLSIACRSFIIKTNRDNQITLNFRAYDPVAFGNLVHGHRCWTLIQCAAFSTGKKVQLVKCISHPVAE